MDNDAYWALVERARAEQPDDVAAALVDLLAALPADEIAAADTAYRRVVAPGHTWALWGAAYLINGGCSDDGFDYFRGWLVARGREVFHRALADPDSLADVVDEDDADEAFDEDVLGAPWLAHERVTGRGLSGGEPVAVPDLGPGWDFDDQAEMARRYPRLAAIFG